MEKGENVTKEREMRGKVKNLLMMFFKYLEQISGMKAAVYH